MTVLLAFAKAALGIVALAAVWVAVDHAWRKMFPDRSGNPGCAGCSACRHRCKDHH